VSAPVPADEERIPPLTVGQLGLCGPLSDDPGVGPDAARHNPTAGDQDERTFPQCIASSCANARAWDGLCAVHLELVESERERDALSGLLRGMARRVGNLRKNGRHFVGITEKLQDRLDSACIERDNLQTELSDLDRLRRNHDALADAYVATREALDHARPRVAKLRRLAEERRQTVPSPNGDVTVGGLHVLEVLAVLDGPAEAPRHNHDNSGVYGGCPACGTYWPELAVGPAEAAEPATDEKCTPAEEAHDEMCPGCDVCLWPDRPRPEAAEPAPDPYEPGGPLCGCNDCEQVRQDAGVEELTDQLRAEAAEAARPDADGRYDLDDVLRETGIDPAEAGAPEPALAAAARQVLAEWSRMHPSGYLAMYPAMDQLRAAVAAPRVEPALLGTWADPEFRAHQDHKHPVDGCGFCPSEEDR
jgi:hypothetical protein